MEAKTKARRLLTMADEISREEYLEEVANYTEEDARKLGYISLEVLRLEDRLSKIVGEWRETKDEALVDEYRDVLYSMILKGYAVIFLPIQEQLPNDKMPFIPPPSVCEAIVKAYNDLED